MTTPKEIGKIFTEAREKRQLSVDKAASESRIHPNVIRDIENGIFDRLGKLYVKSFMKKYALFLGLDLDNVVQLYESISSKVPGRQFDLGVKKQEDKSEPVDILADKRIQTALIGVLSLVLVVLVFVFVGMMRARIAKQPPSTAAEVRTSSAKQTTAPEQEKKPVSSFFSLKKASPSVILTLKATGESWIQISRGDEKVFSGFLKKGESKSWESDQPLTVWTGKADNLEFTVNTRRIGVVAAGVVKNIEVSSEGVRIGDSWKARIK